jgi:cyanophycin synthetase
MTNIIINIYLNFLIRLGILFGVLKWDDDPPKNKLKNRLKYLFQAAKKRKIKIAVLKTLNNYSNLCLAKRNNKKIFFETLPSQSLYKINPDKIDNKYFIKKLLDKNDIPVPVGRKFITLRRAYNYASAIGWPVVIKPCCSSLSQGVTININDINQLKDAIAEAKKFERKFIVEKHVQGENYRVTIIGTKVFASLRKPATVKGDGVMTIKELINKRNRHKLRGPLGEDGWTLRQIDLVTTRLYLAKHNLSLNYKPKKNEVIKLIDKINLGSGADIFDCTGKIHQLNKFKFIEISKVLKAPIVGLDIIMEDISFPHNQQKYYIIEANTLPAIDIHHRPLKGRPRDVAGAIWDLIISENVL